MRNLCCSYDSVLSFPGLGNGNSGSRRPRISSSSCLLSPLLSPFLPSALSFQPSPCFTMVLSHLAMGSYLTKTSPRSFQCLPRSLLGCSFSNDQPPASFSDFSAGGPCVVYCPMSRRFTAPLRSLVFPELPHSQLIPLPILLLPPTGYASHPLMTLELPSFPFSLRGRHAACFLRPFLPFLFPPSLLLSFLLLPTPSVLIPRLDTAISLL